METLLDIIWNDEALPKEKKELDEVSTCASAMQINCMMICCVAIRESVWCILPILDGTC